MSAMVTTESHPTIFVKVSKPVGLASLYNVPFNYY
jgi:hypothetical protein